jgi:hypothetical protein
VWNILQNNKPDLLKDGNVIRKEGNKERKDGGATVD